MASKLAVYNEALILVGSQELATLTDDVEARYKCDNAYAGVVDYVLRQAAWRFALETSSITGTTGSTLAGFTYKFTKPADWLRTQAIYKLSGSREVPLDVREQDTRFHANETPIVVRYVGTGGRTESLWPEHFTKAVAAYLAFSICERLTGDPNKAGQIFNLWQSRFLEAANADAIPDDPWLRHQLSGAFLPAVRYVLEQGNWHFAIKTVELADNIATPSAGFAYAFTRPTDWIKSVFIYNPVGTGRSEVEFREEGGNFHANYQPLVVRYLSSTLGENAANWPDAFSDTVLAYLSFREAMAGAETPGAVIEARRLAYAAALKTAKGRDDNRERPRVNTTGLFVRARWGGHSREQGY